MIERIIPIIEGKMKPKKIVGDLNLIKKRTIETNAKLLPTLRQVYYIALELVPPFSRPKFPTLKSLIQIFSKSKMVQLETGEQNIHFWILIEALKDPEESLFKIIRRREKRGKYDQRFEDRIHHYIQTKVSEEILFEDFKQLIALLVTKTVKVIFIRIISIQNIQTMNRNILIFWNTT